MSVDAGNDPRVSGEAQPPRLGCDADACTSRGLWSRFGNRDDPSVAPFVNLDMLSSQEDCGECDSVCVHSQISYKADILTR